MKTLLSVLSVGLASAHGDWQQHKETCSLKSLAKACGADYQKYCSTVDDLDFVSMLSCGKKHEANLQAGCVAEIKKSFPALYACSDDIHEYCPTFGRLMDGQWDMPTQRTDNDDDDDDDDNHRRGPRRGHGPPPSTGVIPAPNKTTVPPTRPATNESVMRPLGSSSSYNAPSQCLKTNLRGFSASCQNAIAEQWLAEQTKKGVTSPAEPTADEIVAMLTPPAFTSPYFYSWNFSKTQRVIACVVGAVLACVILTCLCCCCRRCCKKRPSPRVAPTPEVGVALSPLPEAAAVPMAAPTAYVPLANPIPQAVPVSQATYMPYTGKGLGTYMPVAQPA